MSDKLQFVVLLPEFLTRGLIDKLKFIEHLGTNSGLELANTFGLTASRLQGRSAAANTFESDHVITWPRLVVAMIGFDHLLLLDEDLLYRFNWLK